VLRKKRQPDERAAKRAAPSSGNSGTGRDRRKQRALSYLGLALLLPLGLSRAWQTADATPHPSRSRSPAHAAGAASPTRHPTEKLLAWGKGHFRKREYAQAIKCFKLALLNNPPVGPGNVEGTEANIRWRIAYTVQVAERKQIKRAGQGDVLGTFTWKVRGPDKKARTAAMTFLTGGTGTYADPSGDKVEFIFKQQGKRVTVTFLDSSGEPIGIRPDDPPSSIKEWWDSTHSVTLSTDGKSMKDNGLFQRGTMWTRAN
jgi:hypothetical protein